MFAFRRCTESNSVNRIFHCIFIRLFLSTYFLLLTLSRPPCQFDTLFKVKDYILLFYHFWKNFYKICLLSPINESRSFCGTSANTRERQRAKLIICLFSFSSHWCFIIAKSTWYDPLIYENEGRSGLKEKPTRGNSVKSNRSIYQIGWYRQRNLLKVIASRRITSIKCLNNFHSLLNCATLHDYFIFFDKTIAEAEQDTMDASFQYGGTWKLVIYCPPCIYITFHVYYNTSSCHKEW